jgi:hypothetical protein
MVDILKAAGVVVLIGVFGLVVWYKLGVFDWIGGIHRASIAEPARAAR